HSVSRTFRPAGSGCVRFPLTPALPTNHVAQISNLLYRRASSLRCLRRSRRVQESAVLPIGNRRYSRLEICATSAGGLGDPMCEVPVGRNLSVREGGNRRQSAGEPGIVETSEGCPCQLPLPNPDRSGLLSEGRAPSRHSVPA